MLGLFLISYVVAPALMVACAAGWGLLVLRVSGDHLRRLYALPLGFAAMLALGAIMTNWSMTAPLTGPAMVLGGVVGLVVGRGHLRGWARPMSGWTWPSMAALGAFLVYLAPALLSGRPTFTGFARIVDIGNQFDFARYLVTEGRLRPEARESSYLEVVTKTLDIGYPAGAQSVFGGFATVLQVDIPWIYQGYLGVAAAMLALAAYLLLARLIDSRLLLALAAGIAPLANVLYGYGLVGGFKELTTVAVLVLTAAVARDTLPGRVPARALVPLAVAISACLAAFNLTAVAFLGVLLVGLFVVSLVRGWHGPPRARARPALAWGVVGLVTIAISAPTLDQALSLAPVAAAAEGGASERTAIGDLGNLAAPMPLEAASGVWISADYRVPASVYERPTDLVMGVVLLLGAIGLAHALRRRDWGVALLGVSCAVALAFFATRTGPWIELKAIAMSGPVVLVLAFAGAGGLLRVRRRPMVARLAGWSLAAIVALGVLSGTALAYHYTTLAPTERLRDLERIGERFAGEGPTLYPAHDEYAEYFLRRSEATAVVNAPGEGNGFPQVRPEAAPTFEGTPFAYDLDELALNWVEAFDLLVLPRDPTDSRPPSNFEQVATTEMHTVWRKIRPADTVLEHVPLQGPDAAATEAACEDLVAQAEEVGEAAQIVLASKRPAVTVPLGTAKASPNWAPADDGESIALYGPGRLQATVKLPSTGEYRVWLKGPNQRDLDASVDGEQVGTVAEQWSYPERWNLLASRELAAGTHTIELTRGGGNFAPGDGATGLPVGPLAFQLVEPGGAQMQILTSEEAEAVCAGRPKAAGVSRRSLDWLELVRGAGALPAGAAPTDQR